MLENEARELVHIVKRGKTGAIASFLARHRDSPVRLADVRYVSRPLISFAFDHKADDAGVLKCVSVLVANGCDLNERFPLPGETDAAGDCTVTPLWYAVIRDSEYVLRELGSLFDVTARQLGRHVVEEAVRTCSFRAALVLARGLSSGLTPGRYLQALLDSDDDEHSALVDVLRCRVTEPQVGVCAWAARNRSGVVTCT